MRAVHDRSVTANWLARRPQRYPSIPKEGMAKKTLAMRRVSPETLIRKVQEVLPSPLMVLISAELVYRNGQIQESVMMKSPAVSL